MTVIAAEEQQTEEKFEVNISPKGTVESGDVIVEFHTLGLEPGILIKPDLREEDDTLVLNVSVYDADESDFLESLEAMLDLVQSAIAQYREGVNSQWEAEARG